MAMVYNAHQMHQILQSYDHLMDKNKCLTFSSFTKQKSTVGSFANFCKLLANNISLKEDPLFCKNEDKKEDVPLPTRKYLKREAFF
jgi:hypothetical protein